MGVASEPRGSASRLVPRDLLAERGYGERREDHRGRSGSFRDQCSWSVGLSAPGRRGHPTVPRAQGLREPRSRQP